MSVFRFACLALAAALCAPLALSQTELARNNHYQDGLRAMETLLPHLAIPRFQKALEAFESDRNARKTIHLKMGEASVRAARQESDPQATIDRAKAARQYLAHADLANDESALFWSAQASLLLSEFQEAADLFARLENAKDLALRTHAQLSRAHLLAAMGREEEAGALLDALARSKDPQTAGEARLLHASLLLAQNNLDAAAALLSAGTASADKTHAQPTRYLQARLALAQGKHEQAVATFRELVEAPEHLGEILRDGALLGLAEALHLTGETEEAIDVLVRFVDEHPRSAILEDALSRLLRWAQTNETLKASFEERMAVWAYFKEDSPAPAAEPPNESGAIKNVIPSIAQERAGFARYYYALYLTGKNAAEPNRLAEELLASIRNDFPDHPLVAAASLEIARLQSAGNRIAEAIATLRTMEQEPASPPVLKLEAAKLIGLLEFREGEFQAAAEAFLRARQALEPEAAALAAVNAGVSLLYAGDTGTFRALLEGLEPSELRATLQLEQALYQASLGTSDARPLLHRFIAENRNHPRIAEARLAHAEEWLRHEPHATSAHQQAEDDLGAIDPARQSYQVGLRHLLARLKLSELTNDWKPAIAQAKRFISTRETGDLDPAIRLKLAEAYLNNGDLNFAQIEFQDIAAKVENQENQGMLYEVALYFAAEAALKKGTESSPEEAARLLQRVIDAGGMLAQDARLLLARSQIDQSIPDQALRTLSPLLAEDAPRESQLDALVLAAEAHQALGNLGNEQEYREAIKICDRVLAREDLSYANSNRLHFLKGRIYESLKDPGSALDTYYIVINGENLRESAEREWHWYTDCAFRAVQILEQGPRWPAAVEILRKLEESDSPPQWRKKAADRRKGLQLERQQWDSE